MFNNNNPTVKKLQKQNERLQKQTRQLTTLTTRSEVTGGAAGYTNADLPTANKEGQIAYCSNCRKSGEGAGVGTGVLAVVTMLAGILQWANCDDLNQPVQV